jgi:hypothetical protein
MTQKDAKGNISIALLGVVFLPGTFIAFLEPLSLDL